MNPGIGLIVGLVVGGVLGYLLRRSSPGAGGPGEGADHRNVKVKITLDEEPGTGAARAQVSPDPAWVTAGQQVRWQVVNKCGQGKKASLAEWTPNRPGHGNDATNGPVPGHGGTNEDICLDTDIAARGPYKYSVQVDGTTILDPGIIIDKP